MYLPVTPKGQQNFSNQKYSSVGQKGFLCIVVVCILEAFYVHIMIISSVSYLSTFLYKCFTVM